LQTSSIVLPGLVRQEHAVYSDVIVLLGESGGEQLAVFRVLGVLHVLHELPDCGFVFPLHWSRIRHTLISV
jgi:hypothetical protein